MIKNYLQISKDAIMICIILISLVLQSNAQKKALFETGSSGACNNLDFSMQTTQGWNGAWCGSASQMNYFLDVNNLPNKGFNSSNGTNQPNFVQEIMVAGMDALAPISTVPPGHTHSLRLGSDSAKKALALASPARYPHNHQMISNTFVVTPSNAAITCWNAIVFTRNKQTPHIDQEQQYVSYRVLDPNNNIIACTKYLIKSELALLKNDFKTKDIPDSLFMQYEQIVYRDWTSTYIPLEKYIGQQVTIQFETNDCFLGGHCAYMYLAVDCSPVQTITVSPLKCQNDSAIVSAPAGFAGYSWTGPGITSPINKQTINIHTSGKYSVKLVVIGTQDTCTYVMDTTISLNLTPPVAQFSNGRGCAGQPLLFSDKSTLNAKTTSWSWDFNNDGIEDSNLQHPTHVFNLPGTYFVKLTIAQDACKDEIEKSILINQGYELIITHPVDSLSSSVDITKSAITAGSTAGAVLSYWMDAAATVPLVNPTTVTKSGTYFIKIGQDSCSLIKPVIVKIGIISSVKSTTGPPLFNLYPNPASQQITVEIKKETEIGVLTIELINILGEQLYSYKTEHAGSRLIKQIDISMLPKSIYFIRCKTIDSDNIQKIICQ